MTTLATRPFKACRWLGSERHASSYSSEKEEKREPPGDLPPVTLSLLGIKGTFILFDAGEAGSATATGVPHRGRAGANRAVASHTSWAVVFAASRAVKKPEQANGGGIEPHVCWRERVG